MRGLRPGLGFIKKCVELLIVVDGGHVELHANGVFFAGGVAPPLPLKFQDVVFCFCQHRVLLLRVWGEGGDDDVLHGLRVIGDVHNVPGEVFNTVEAGGGVGEPPGGFLDGFCEFNGQRGF